MGKVVERIRLSNQSDHARAIQGELRADQVRSVEIDALVDTGATRMAIPADVADALGLVEVERCTVRVADGRLVELSCKGGILLTVLGRSMICDALVVPAGATALLGQIPLEGLDLVVDPQSRTLHVNPASPDSPLMDLLSVA